MGKIVRGARASDERYAVVVPEIAAPAPPSQSVPEPFAFDAFGDVDPFAPLGAAEPAAPALDVDAIRRETERILDEARAGAEALLGDAHERARAMIEDAANRADAIAEDARRGGQQSGYAAGTQAADREMSDLLATMRGLVDMARTERHRIIQSAEPELVRLALGIAERVLHQQIALDRSVVVEMARTAVSRLVDRETVTVRVNPADIERMREHREDMLGYSDIKHLRIVEDQRVDRGGVVIETDAGTIDAKVATQLAEAKKVLHIEDDIVLTPADDTVRPLHAARAS